jgi:hypothetical protein
MSDGAYDCWKTRAPEDDGAAPVPCPICTGDRDAEPCSEECDELILRAKTVRMVRHSYDAVREALRLARTYLVEGGNADHRYRACLDQIGAYRRFIRTLRATLALQAEDIGLVDTLPAPPCSEAAQ